MRSPILLGVLALMNIAPAFASDGPVPPLSVAAGSKIWVEGTSTVRSFSCQAPTFDLAIDAAPDAAAQVVAGQKAVKTVTLTVPAETLDCGNTTMDGHMQKALKVDANPSIRFALTTYELAGGDVKMTGTLALGGTTRTITLTAKAAPGADGGLKVTGSHALKLSEYGLKAPSLMMGTMKVGDTVTVKFDLNLK